MASHMPTMSQQPQIQLKYIFGMNEQISCNVIFQDDDHLLYVAGYQVVLMDLKDKSQIFFQGISEFRGFSCLSVSPRRSYLAVGTKNIKNEKSESQPSIVIFDVMVHQRKKKQLDLNDPSVTIKKWESIAFGSGQQEGKLLISLSSQIDKEGDICVCFWQWDKNRCQSMIKIPPGNFEAKQVQFNYNDFSFFTVTGQKCFKYYQRVETQDEGNKNVSIKVLASQLNNLPVDVDTNFTCQAWLSCEQNLVICNSKGEIIICDNNGEYSMILQDSPKFKQGKDFQIECIVISGKGFFVAGENSMIFQYKQTNDDQAPFECVNSFTIKTTGTDITKENNKILAISIAPIGEDKLVCQLSSNQIYSVKIKKDSLIHENEELTEAISPAFHSGAIYGMDICVRKPLIATCGADKSIKIWNYEERALEISWTYPDEASCLSFHPSGFHLLAAFADKLKLMNICIHNKQSRVDNKNFYKEYPVKQCKEVRFSNGGQYFAAVVSAGNTNSIQVYKFYTGQAPANMVFKGHNGRVKSIAWSQDDSVLCSCDQSGIIYAWRIEESTVRIFDSHIKDSHLKGVQLQSVALTQDTKYSYVSGNDRHLYICENFTQGTYEKKILDVNFSSLSFPSSNKLLFCGISDEARSSGAIRCYQHTTHPISHGKHQDYTAHDERGVEKIKITFDDRYLISAGRDSCIMIFEIKDKDAKAKIRSGYSKPSDEILVTRADLDDIKTSKEQLKQSYQEYTSPNSNLTLGSKDDQIKQQKEQLTTNIQKYKADYDNLLEKKRELEKKYEEEYKKQKELNETEIQELDTSYQKKVMDEVEKFENAKRLLEIETNKNNKNKERTLQKNQAEIRALQEKFRDELSEQRTQRERVQKEIDVDQKEYTEIISQIKFEAGEEKKELEERYKKDSQNISESGLKAKSDVSITNKRIQEQERQRQDQEEDKKAQEERKEEFDKENIALKDSIEKQKKDIQERDKQIGEKERKIYELKKRSQELEKFKFVLDHKIKELKRDIGPREDEIARMKIETKKMDKKLKTFNHINTTLGTVVDELDTTQEDMKEQIKKQRQIVSVQNVKIKQFKDDVYKTVQHILNPEKLKEETEELYKKYSNKDIKKVEVDKEIEQEYQSQKKYLEKTVAMLKKNLQKDKDIHKQDNIRIIRENVELIKEINQLRTHIKNMTHGINKGPQSHKDEKKDLEAQENEQEIIQKKSIIDQQSQEIIAYQEQLEALKEETQHMENQLREIQQEQMQ